jgi:hypothetical protein
MKVLLLSRYPRIGASRRLRSYQSLPGLAENGIEVSVSPLFSKAYLEDFYRSGKKRPTARLSAYWSEVQEVALIESAPLRQEMGRIGRAKVEQHFHCH